MLYDEGWRGLYHDDGLGILAYVTVGREAQPYVDDGRQQAGAFLLRIPYYLRLQVESGIYRHVMPSRSVTHPYKVIRRAYSPFASSHNHVDSRAYMDARELHEVLSRLDYEPRARAPWDLRHVRRVWNIA